MIRRAVELHLKAGDVQSTGHVGGNVIRSENPYGMISIRFSLMCDGALALSDAAVALTMPSMVLRYSTAEGPATASMRRTPVVSQGVFEFSRRPVVSQCGFHGGSEEGVLRCQKTLRKL